MTQRPAPPRYCPTCGGPGAAASGGACEYCGGPRLPVGVPDPRHAVRCPRCVALVAAGGTYCCQCGAALAADDGHVELGCPGCGNTPMITWGRAITAVKSSGLPLYGCERCGGVWVPRDGWTAMLEDASPLGRAAGIAETKVHRRQLTDASSPVRYRACPECKRSMLRKNFATISGVVLDQCREHGAFFDAGELEDVLAFVRTGGLQAAQRRGPELGRPVDRPDFSAFDRDASPWFEAHLRQRLAEDVAAMTTAFVRWVRGWMGRLPSNRGEPSGRED